MSHLKNVQRESDVVVPKTGEVFVSEDGVVSKVIDDFVDDSYEPTEEEIREFAEYIGMKLPEDEELLYIARNCLKTPLPKYWKPCQTNDKEIYFFNFKTGESKWEHPMDDIARRTFEKEKERRKALQSTEAKKSPFSAGINGFPASSTGGLGGKSVLSTSDTSLKGNVTNLNLSGSMNSVRSVSRTIFTSDGILQKEEGKAVPTSLMQPNANPTQKPSANRAPPTNGSTPKKAGTTSPTPARSKPASSGPVGGGSLSISAFSPATTKAGSTNASKPSKENYQLPTASDTSDSSEYETTSSESTHYLPNPQFGQSKNDSRSSAVSNPTVLRSEAEVRMEENLRREISATTQRKRENFEKELQERRTAMQSKFNEKMKTLRDEDVERRRKWREEKKEEKEKIMHSKRLDMHNKYNDELRGLERKVDQLTSELARVEKENTRQIESETVQRQLLAQEAEKELADRVKMLIRDMELERAKKEKELRLSLAQRRKVLEKESEEMMKREKESLMSKLSEDQKRKRSALEADRQRLESEKIELQKQLEQLRMESSTSPVDAKEAKEDVTASIELQIAEINEKRDEKLAQLKADAEIERKAVKENQDLEIEKLHYLISKAKTAKEASEEAKEAALKAVEAVNKNKEIEKEKRIKEKLEEERKRRKSVRMAEHQCRMAELEEERKAKLFAVEEEMEGRKPSPSDESHLQRLLKEHEEAIEAKRSMYRKMEDDLCQKLAEELEAKEEKEEEEKLEAAVAQELERYKTDILIRRERLEQEHQLRLKHQQQQLNRMRADAKQAAIKSRKAELEARVAAAMEKRRQISQQQQLANKQREEKELKMKQLETIAEEERKEKEAIDAEMAASSTAQLTPLEEKLREQEEALKHDTFQPTSLVDPAHSAKEAALEKELQQKEAMYAAMLVNGPQVNDFIDPPLPAQGMLAPHPTGEEAKQIQSLEDFYTRHESLLREELRLLKEQIQLTLTSFSSGPQPIPALSPPNTVQLVLPSQPEQGAAEVVAAAPSYAAAVNENILWDSPSDDNDPTGSRVDGLQGSSSLEAGEASLHTKEALRVLRANEVESSRRKDALNHAKRKWRQDMEELNTQGGIPLGGEPSQLSPAPVPSSEITGLQTSLFLCPTLDHSSTMDSNFSGNIASLLSRLNQRIDHLANNVQLALSHSIGKPDTHSSGFSHPLQLSVERNKGDGGQDAALLASKDRNESMHYDPAPEGNEVNYYYGFPICSTATPKGNVVDNLADEVNVPYQEAEEGTAPLPCFQTHADDGMTKPKEKREKLMYNPYHKLSRNLDSEAKILKNKWRRNLDSLY